MKLLKENGINLTFFVKLAFVLRIRNYVSFNSVWGTHLIICHLTKSSYSSHIVRDVIGKRTAPCDDAIGRSLVSRAANLITCNVRSSIAGCDGKVMKLCSERFRIVVESLLIFRIGLT